MWTLSVGLCGLIARVDVLAAGLSHSDIFNLIIPALAHILSLFFIFSLAGFIASFRLVTLQHFISTACLLHRRMCVYYIHINIRTITCNLIN